MDISDACWKICSSRSCGNCPLHIVKGNEPICSNIKGNMKQIIQTLNNWITSKGGVLDERLANLLNCENISQDEFLRAIRYGEGEVEFI